MSHPPTYCAASFASARGRGYIDQDRGRLSLFEVSQWKLDYVDERLNGQNADGAGSAGFVGPWRSRSASRAFSSAFE
jgi:hypothetical protein